MHTPSKSHCDVCRAAVTGCPLHRAAPALLAACEKARKALEAIKATGKINWKLVDVGYGITELNAAIAAAKGE